MKTYADYKKEIDLIFPPWDKWDEVHLHRSHGKYYINVRRITGLQLEAVQKIFTIVTIEGETWGYGNICIEMVKK